MPPAARVTDMHTCPMVTPGVPPIPHVGGPILPPGAPTVLIDFLPAATVTSMATCVGPPDMVAMGSTGVMINSLPAARLGDPTVHGGVIVMGSPTVIVGETGSAGGGAGGLGGVMSGLAVSGANAPMQEKESELNQAGSLHNQTWDKVEDTDFHPSSKTFDINHLTDDQTKAAAVLNDQGRTRGQILEVLQSGKNFREAKLKKGEVLYGFTSKGIVKHPDSPYWITKDEYVRLHSKYCNQGVWDRQGIKNELALPCHNRADAICARVLTSDCTAVQSTINPATENTFYTRNDVTIAVKNNSMRGGGSQVAPDPKSLGPLAFLR